MSKTMPKSTKEEKYRWIKPILNGEMTIKLMAAVCPFSERALKYWLADFREHGIAGLENSKGKRKSPHFKAGFSDYFSVSRKELLSGYSLRKASIGSIRAALRAGSKPKAIPQIREKATATIKE